MERIAVISGATGLVGRSLLDTILAEDFYSKIIIVSRRHLPLKDNRIEEIIIDFDKLDEVADKLNGHDHYCCLGTTMAQAKTKENFRKIDLEYPLKLAEIASKGSHFRHFIVVTALGADSDSALFYNEVKGELEDKLIEMNLPSLHIFKPSLLLGAREKFRLGEEIAKILTNILSFFIIRVNKLWSIKGSTVARAMFLVAKKDQQEVAVYKPKKIRKIAGTL